MTTPRPQLPGQPSSRPARPDQLQPGPADPSLPAAHLDGPDPRGPALPSPDMHGPALHDPDLHGPGAHDPDLHWPGVHDPGLHDPDLHGPGLHPARLPVLPPFPRQPGWPRPLPDVVAVRRLPLPDSAPPYDDQRVSPAPTSPPGASAETGSPQSGSPEPARPAEGQPGQPGVAGQQEQPPPGGPPGLAGMPGAWPSQFAQVLAEALAGARPAQQLTSWTTQRARSRIRRLGPVLQSGPRPRVVRVLGSAPASDVVELTIILSVGSAVRALAVRLERAGPVPPGRVPDGPLRGIRHQAGRQPGGPGSAGDEARGPGLAWLCTEIEAA